MQRYVILSPDFSDFSVSHLHFLSLLQYSEGIEGLISWIYRKLFNIRQKIATSLSGNSKLFPGMLLGLGLELYKTFHVKVHLHLDEL